MKRFRCKFCKKSKGLNYYSSIYPFCKIKFCKNCNVKYFLEKNDKGKFYLNEIHYYFSYDNEYYAVIHVKDFFTTLHSCNDPDYKLFDQYFLFPILCYSFYSPQYKTSAITEPYFDLFKCGKKPKQVEAMFLKFMKIRNIL